MAPSTFKALFTECRRCFYIDIKLGRCPPGFPFNLASAVDALLKEFDIRRVERASAYDALRVDAVLYDHPDLDIWRENFKGIEFSTSRPA